VSYIDESLAAGEVVLYRTRLHWIVMLWPILVALVFSGGAIALFIASVGSIDPVWSRALAITGVVCAVVAVSSLIAGVVRRSSTEMAVTNRRVLMKSGILSRNSTELMLAKVESIGVNQDLLGRIAGYGKVVVRGTGGTYELFDRVARPMEFRRRVQEQIHQLHGEPVRSPATQA
jgi:uncharacterized membrane protein YdbT with pleckstrin-like domain